MPHMLQFYNELFCAATKKCNLFVLHRLSIGCLVIARNVPATMAANHSICDVQLFQFKNENETIYDRIEDQSSVFVVLSACFLCRSSRHEQMTVVTLIGIAAHI